MVVKYSLNENDIPLSGPDQLLPGLFGKGKGGMKRFAIAEDEKLRAGFTKILKGGGVSTYFWYDEIWWIIDGDVDVTAVTRSENKTEKFNLKTRDALFIPTGTHITARVNSDRLLFMYIAVPASSKDGRWLAYMTPEDIQDIRKRNEFASKDPWTSGRADST